MDINIYTTLQYSSRCLRSYCGAQGAKQGSHQGSILSPGALRYRVEPLALRPLHTRLWVAQTPGRSLFVDRHVSLNTIHYLQGMCFNISLATLVWTPPRNKMGRLVDTSHNGDRLKLGTPACIAYRKHNPVDQ